MNKFSTNEIVCLKYEQKSLYCEVIDTIKDRDLLWVRPIMLVDIPDDDYINIDEINNIYDLRHSSDLLWHINAFSPVFDTEYITFLSKLQESDWNEKKSNLARKKLKLFLEKIPIQ